MTAWQVPVGCCHVCGHPFSDHCERVSIYILARLKRSRSQNRRLVERIQILEADLAFVTGQRDVYLDEVRKLNKARRSEMA